MIRKGTAVLLLLFATLSARAQTPTAPMASSQQEMLKNVESYLRNLFAWGQNFQVKLGPFAQSPTTDFYEIPVQVTSNGQSNSGIVYVSKDGRFLFRGEMYDLTANPFAATLAKIHLEGEPSRGPADARVTVVEFSDFECPHCRELHIALRALEPRYPQVRFVFKDFPLTEIHPWAMTAAIAARCAFEQSPNVFWEFRDAIFVNQELISAENVWDKLAGFATQVGIASDVFRACMASPEPKQAVEANLAEGRSLQIGTTPTVFVNGREIVGGDKDLIEQYINFELPPFAPKPQPKLR